MNLKRLSLFWLITLVALAGLFPTLKPSAAASPYQTTDAPYLMAFSDSPAPHFLIERADGTDSRTFGEDLMPEDSNYVSGPGWSPSGQWYAWTADTHRKENNRGSTAYILSTDGQTRPTGLDDLGRVSLAWSPDADVLVVAGLLNPPIIVFDEEKGEYVTTNDADTLTMRIGLFDPATDEFIIVQDMPAPYEHYQLLEVSFRVQWRNDAEYGLVRAAQIDESGAASTRYYRLGMNGEYGFTDYDPATLMFDAADSYYAQPLLTDYGEVMLLQNDGSVRVEDVVTGSHWELRVGDNETIQHISWSDDDERALITTQFECEEAGCPQQSLWLYTRADDQLSKLLPPQSAWFTLYPAPDFQRLVYVQSRNDGDYAMYLDLADPTPIDLGQKLDSDTYGELVRWTTPSRFVIPVDNRTYWTTLFAAYDGPSRLGEFSGSTYDSLPPIAPNRPTALIAYADVTLVDVTSGETTTLPPDPRRYFTSYRGSALWHPTEDYALLFEDALVAGGGAPMYTGVVSGDGSVHHPLGYCHLVTPRCAEWLPAQVDPTTLAPGHDNILPTPFMRIPMGHWTDELIWSPAVHQIAASNEMRWFGEPGAFDVWDVTNGEHVITLPDVTYEQTIAWPEMQPIVVSREVTPPDAYPRILARIPDGSLTVQIVPSPGSGGFGTTVEVVDAIGQRIFNTFDPYIDWHASASIDPFGLWVAVSSANSPVQIYDAATGEVVYKMPLVYSNAVAFSPDGYYLAVAYGTEIRIYIISELLEGAVR